MKIISLFLAGVLVSFIAHADVYKWQDANGKWCFSDALPTGINAESVETIKSVEPIPKISKQNNNTGEQKELIDSVELQEAAIMQELSASGKYINFTLRPLWINNNSVEVEISYTTYFYNRQNTEMYSVKRSCKINANTTTSTPDLITMIDPSKADSFDYNFIHHIVIKYKVYEENKEKEFSDVKLQISNSNQLRQESYTYTPQDNTPKKDLRYILSTVTMERAGHSDYVRITGRISGGDSCENLLILMQIEEEDSGNVWYPEIKAKHKAASSLFEGSQYVGAGGRRWKMKDVKYQCDD